MRHRFCLGVAVLAVALACVPGVASAQAKPIRHLVYNFTVGVTGDQVNQENADVYAMGPIQPVIHGPGSTDYQGLVSDKGQIAVDVAGIEPDGGLIVTVSETDRRNRAASPATCVVYPDTSVVCGAGALHPEEESVIRTLSPKFFDASALDANRHWQVGNAAAGVKIDFSATPNPDGVTLGITSDRVQKATNGNSVQSNGKYTYDTSKLLSTALSEYETIRQQSGASQYSTVVIDVTATLVSDSGMPKT